jgi:hypothetical protein
MRRAVRRPGERDVDARSPYPHGVRPLGVGHRGARSRPRRRGGPHRVDLRGLQCSHGSRGWNVRAAGVLPLRTVAGGDRRHAARRGHRRRRRGRCRVRCAVRWDRLAARTRRRDVRPREPDAGPGFPSCVCARGLRPRRSARRRAGDRRGTRAHTPLNLPGRRQWGLRRRFPSEATSGTWATWRRPTSTATASQT